jgi:tetratricopeptide (TPR) repeat protein
MTFTRDGGSDVSMVTRRTIPRQRRAVLWVAANRTVRGMQAVWRPARSGRLFHLLLPLLLAATNADADATRPAAPAVPAGPPASAAADAQTYARCMNLTRQNPREAQSLARAWFAHGGAHPAEHCAAVALIALGSYREGATHLQALAKAMTTAPASLRADVLDQAGQAWLLAGDPVRAYAAAGEAVSLQPGDPDLLIDRAEAAASAGYYDRAIGDLDRVLKTHPDRVDALIYRASAYRALDRLDPARADIDNALAQQPHSAAALLERGNIRRLEGDSAGARSDWQEIGQIAPGSPEDMAARANLEHLAAGDGKVPSATPIGKAPTR